jgi:hypothetical protein
MAYHYYELKFIKMELNIAIYAKVIKLNIIELNYVCISFASEIREISADLKWI